MSASFDAPEDEEPCSWAHSLRDASVVRARYSRLRPFRSLVNPDPAVGLGRRHDAGIGHTARPLPIAVADSPIEAASPGRIHSSRCAS